MGFYKLNKKSMMNIFIYILLFTLVCSLILFVYGHLFNNSQLEGLESNNATILNNMGFETSISTDNAHNFCLANQGSGSILNDSCNKLTKLNCQSTECCMWADSISNTGKCVAGDKTNGPLFPNQ